jgi:hypothetical protein
MRLTTLRKDSRALEDKNGVERRWEWVIRSFKATMRLEYVDIDFIHTISTFHGHSAMALAAA